MPTNYTKVGAGKSCIISHTHTKKTPHENHPLKPTSYNSGFQLIEQCIVVSILSILIGSVSPHFTRLTNKIKVRTTAHEIQNALQLARNNALYVTKNTIICPLTPKEKSKCSDDKEFNADWSHGWLIFTDINNNSQFDNSDKIVRLNRLHHQVNIIFNQRGALRFFHDGSARSAGFYVCKEETEESRHIKLLYTGRSRTTKINNAKQQSICLSSSNKK